MRNKLQQNEAIEIWLEAVRFANACIAAQKVVEYEDLPPVDDADKEHRSKVMAGQQEQAARLRGRIFQHVR